MAGGVHPKAEGSDMVDLHHDPPPPRHLGLPATASHPSANLALASFQAVKVDQHLINKLIFQINMLLNY